MNGSPPRIRGWIAALLIALAGWIASAFPFWLHSSIDLLQWILPGDGYPRNDCLIVFMDEQSTKEFHQSSGQDWDRKIHANLINHITQGNPKVIVLDVLMNQPRDRTSDMALAEAMRQSGNVVLVGVLEDTKPFAGITDFEPLPIFATNAAAWGLAEVMPDAQDIVRRIYPGTAAHESLPWAAARVADAAVTQDPRERRRRWFWLNYYGSANPFAHHTVSYANAYDQSPDTFANKAVFIGGKPDTLHTGQLSDVFVTPFNTPRPGVEFLALGYANLLHANWLTQWGLWWEGLVFLISGCVLGMTAQRSRRPRSFWIASALACAMAAAVIPVILATQTWFCWTPIPGVQWPLACLTYLFAKDKQSAAAIGQAPPPAEATRTATELSSTLAESLTVSDHTLLRCIGEGAYGQVWIARNAIGLYHAVKVIYRQRFGDDHPYDRAFRGIRKFMPISRSHDGFIHVLHVARDEAKGMFYYIMEAGDDQQRGQDIDPADYRPKTLSTVLKQDEKLAPKQCLDLLLALTDTVDRLHQRQLIHRDIKPANIVYVHGRPKLADIDLVTQLSDPGEVSRIGTQGYMAPEGPGTATADVFSLGRLLYVLLTGKHPDQCPELPTRLADAADPTLFMDLIQICAKACENEVSRRYPSAQAMHDALQKLSNTPSHLRPT